MIAKDSPLRLLPSALDRRQALYFDGIRHAVEIADLAFHRLCACLAHITVHGHSDGAMTAAFADAWTFVDAVHRYRSLYKLVPGFAEFCGPPVESDLAFLSQLAAIHKLRNLTDHIATRVDQVLARRMPVLGALSWFAADADVSGGKICVLAPGSITGKNRIPAVNPAGKEMTLYSGIGLARLFAGEHEVCLPEVHQGLSMQIRRLEVSIGEQIAGMNHSGSDTLVVMTIAFQGSTALPG